MLESSLEDGERPEKNWAKFLWNSERSHKQLCVLQSCQKQIFNEITWHFRVRLSNSNFQPWQACILSHLRMGKSNLRDKFRKKICELCNCSEAWAAFSQWFSLGGFLWTWTSKKMKFSAICHLTPKDVKSINLTSDVDSEKCDFSSCYMKKSNEKRKK